jgi:hypothetical protein
MKEEQEKEKGKSPNRPKENNQANPSDPHSGKREREREKEKEKKISPVPDKANNSPDQPQGPSLSLSLSPECLPSPLLRRRVPLYVVRLVENRDRICALAFLSFSLSSFGGLLGFFSFDSFIFGGWRLGFGWVGGIGFIIIIINACGLFVFLCFFFVGSERRGDYGCFA